MKEYPKTTNLLERDPDTHKCTDVFRRSDFAQIARWHVTEKVDGTNIRVLLRWSPDSGLAAPDVRGRTDRANTPGDLIDTLTNTLTANRDAVEGWVRYLTNDEPDVIVCLYGEGYGAGIQKVGTQYRAGKSIRLFDVTTSRYSPMTPGMWSPRWWRPWSTVQEAADVTGFKTVPVIDESLATADVLDLVRSGNLYSYTALDDSENGDLIAEGVIARTDPYLFTWDRQRVMFKLKGCDL